MSSNRREGRMWPLGVAKGESEMEVVTAGVDEGAGGQMGLAKTSGADEGGSEIKAEAGADDTGMGITGLWAELSRLWCQPLEGAFVDSNFCMNALLKLNPPDAVACCFYLHLWAQLLQATKLVCMLLSPIQAHISWHENTPYIFCKFMGKLTVGA